MSLMRVENTTTTHIALVVPNGTALTVEGIVLFAEELKAYDIPFTDELNDCSNTDHRLCYKVVKR